MKNWVFLTLVGLAGTACVEDNDPDNAGEGGAAQIAGDTLIRDLEVAQIPQVCRITNPVGLIGSAEFICGAIGALQYDPDYESETCEEATQSCQVAYEARRQVECELVLGREFEFCDATVGMWIACAEESAEAIRPILAEVSCASLAGQGDEPRRGINRRIQDASDGPACQILSEACDGPDFEPEPIPAEPEPGPMVEPDPVPPEPEPEPEPGDIIYDTLIIFDDGSMDDGQGTSGVDICGVSSDCAAAISASSVRGDGSVCDAEGPGCLTDRGDANAALDDGSACEIDNVPSDFISLGSDGQLAVGFDGDLAGCIVTVVEFAGAIQEAWEAYICDSDDVGNASCLNNDSPIHSAAAGGEASFAVPAE